MNRKLKGFTLIELLIVIAVIAILATVVITNFGSARQRARYTTALEGMQEATKVVNTCFSLDGTVTAPASNATVCTYPSANVGDVNTKWPDVTKWSFQYNAGANVASQSAYAVTIQEVDSGGTPVAGKTITCNKNGCSQSGLGI